MNPDNPYAAPQTIEPQQLAADESLPVAALVGRQRYPEVDTPTLEWLAKLSRAIEAATVLWMFPLMGAVGQGAWMLLLQKQVNGWISAGTLVVLWLSCVRLYINSARKTAHRLVIRCADALLLTVVIVGAVWCFFLFWQAPELMILLLLVLGSFALLLVRSIRATFYVQALFGPTAHYVHWRLVTEAEYRRANQIP